MRGGAIPQGRKAVKEGGLLLLDSYVQPSLFDSRVQPSSAKASCPAHINHFSSLLHGVSSVVSTIAEEPLMCFGMDGTKPAVPFPSLPLGWVPSIQ